MLFSLLGVFRFFMANQCLVLGLDFATLNTKCCELLEVDLAIL